MVPQQGIQGPGRYYKTISVRFYAELNDFLKTSLRYREFNWTYKGEIKVKGAVESLGVPHSAVDMVLVNGCPAGFQRRLKHGDHLSVFPQFETFDISGISKVRKKPLRNSCFIVDAHLGKLLRDLRMLGFDSTFAGNLPDEKIIETATTEKRIILTRDRELLKSDKVDHGYYVRATNTKAQLEEVVRKFDLWSQFDPFARCLICNGLLKRVPLEEIRDEINPDAARIFSDFYRCCGCHRVFWEGSHYSSMMKFIEKLISSRNFTE